MACYYSGSDQIFVTALGVALDAIGEGMMGPLIDFFTLGNDFVSLAVDILRIII